MHDKKSEKPIQIQAIVRFPNVQKTGVDGLKKRKT